MTKPGAVAAGLAVAAVLRVTVYALAFPFFNQVDEHQHVDSVLRYARGELPGREMARLDPTVARWALEFGTFEYLEPGPDFPAPYLKRPGASLQQPLVRQANAAFVSIPDTEFDSPPVYYALAAAWLMVGRALSLDGVALLYWLRCLNAVVLGALVFATHRVLRRQLPERPLLHLGVPALLAFFPQDCLFGVTTDGVAIATGGLAFLALAGLANRSGPASPSGYAGAGLGVAAAFLTKYTSASLVMAAAWLAFSEARRRDRGPASALARRWAAFSAGAGLPVAVWFVRNRLVLGDWTGTARKVAHLEWTPRPLADWLAHPLFTPSGVVEFAAGLLPRLWRGEFLWHGQMMASAAADAAYVGATLLLCGVVAFAWLRSRAVRADAAGRIDGLAGVALGGAVATLVFLSVRFEFAHWGTPTAEHPFFVHGRLISGAILPLCWLFVRGIDRLARTLPTRLAPRIAWGVLALWIAAVTVSEIVINAPAFASPYNAFG